MKASHDKPYRRGNLHPNRYCDRLYRRSNLYIQSSKTKGLGISTNVENTRDTNKATHHGHTNANDL